MINDYFFPLTNVEVLIKTLVVFGCWEVIGSCLAKLLKSPSTAKPSYWIMGAGAWVSFWFFLHWFVPFERIYVWSSLLVPSLILGFFYFKNQLWRFWIVNDFILLLISLIFILLPVIKPLLYQTALPPRVWDDLAYHINSPAQVKLNTTWNFNSVLGNVKYDYYSMMPRFLETGFILLFTLTNSYAPGQLWQLFIVISLFLTLASFLKKRVSLVSALAFLWLGVYLNTDVLLSSTTAYIDMGGAAISILVFVVLVEAILSRKDEFLLTSAVFTGLALGTKYSTATFVLSSYITFSLFWIKNNLSVLATFSTLQKKVGQLLTLGLGLTILFMLFGGYWYLKNWWLTGSPIYPFGVCAECPGQKFLEGWGYLPFTLANWELIVTQTFWQSWKIYVLTIMGAGLSLIVAGYQKQRWTLAITIFTLAVLVIEVAVASKFSLYGDRFFSHWKLIIGFLLCLPFSFKADQKDRLLWFSKAFAIIIWLVWLLLIQHYLTPLIEKNKKNLSDMNKIDATEQYFVRQKISFEEWLSIRFSDTYQLIKWCGEHPQMVDVYTVDPEVIWNWDGLARAFFINCQLKSLPFDLVSTQQPITQILADYGGSYIWSKQECQNKISLDYKNDYKQNLAEFNNQLICQSRPIVEELYQLPKE